MSDRWRGIPKEVLRTIFSEWASSGYTLDSVHIEKDPDFDPNAPYEPEAYGWIPAGGGWWYLLFPERVPKNRGNRALREFRKAVGEPPA